MHPTLNIAVRAARAAGDIIIRHVDRIDELTVSKKQRNDFVTEVDRMAESEVIRILRRSFPRHGILAEESGRQDGDDNLWIIDPLDGTTNFLHGFPQFAVSIALMHKSRLEQAVVYDPMRQELFLATRGSGATLNGRRIRVSRRKGLDGALLGTGFPFKASQDFDTYLAVFRQFMQSTAGIRRPGSASLDLAYVAAGRLDGMWETDLKIWDIAAGALLIREAGGIVGDLAGGDSYLDSGNLLAANPRVFHAMLETLKPYVGAVA
jgi:myo-inositol-1(or 4)-monophosphatase